MWLFLVQMKSGIRKYTFPPISRVFSINVPSTKIIAYAPSIASSKYDLILRDRKRSRAIKELDFVFPRDYPTSEITNMLRPTQSNIVVDPTVLIENWDEFESGFDLGFKYILYYGYNPTPRLVKWLRHLSSHSSLRLVCLNFEYSWCNYAIPCGPFDFLAVMKKGKLCCHRYFSWVYLLNTFRKKIYYC